MRKYFSLRKKYLFGAKNFFAQIHFSSKKNLVKNIVKYFLPKQVFYVNLLAQKSINHQNEADHGAIDLIYCLQKQMVEQIQLQ